MLRFPFHLWRRLITRPVLACLVGLSLILAACGGGGTSSSSSSSGPVNLTFWSWVPHIDQAVNLFNKTHSNIHVTLDQVPSGTSGTYAKMLTAIKAGNPPDLGQIEFDLLPTFETTGGLLDLSKYGAASVKSQFVPWTWNQVTIGSAIYAIPQDTGPIELYYRQDIFSKYNIPVPTTWAQFAQDAVKLHAANPNEYMTDFPPKDPAWFAALAWQNNARWFQIQGQSWKVGINDAATQQVASYWQNLLNQHVLKTEADFATGWYHDLATGAVATWIGAPWSAEYLEGIAAPTASGDWRVAPIPQWTAGQTVSSNWGGSTTAVFKATKYPQQATEFAEWLNTNLQSWNYLYANVGFPALTAAWNLSGLTGPNSYFGGQHLGPLFKKSAQEVNPSFQWGPTMSQVFADMGDDFSNALNGKTTLSGALSQTQSSTVTNMKQQGFSVTQ
jgi:multiple sugar transport system substrate-binding protein